MKFCAGGHALEIEGQIVQAGMRQNFGGKPFIKMIALCFRLKLCPSRKSNVNNDKFIAELYKHSLTRSITKKHTSSNVNKYTKKLAYYHNL